MQRGEPLAQVTRPAEGQSTSGSLTPESAPLSAAFKVKCASLFSKPQAEFRFC